MVSRVLAATPPSVPAAGEGRMKALGSAASCAIRVLSARIEPPVRAEDGSTASTANLWPRRAGVRQEVLHQRPRRSLVIEALRFDQRDGARQHGTLARADAVHERCDV